MPALVPLIPFRGRRKRRAAKAASAAVAPVLVSAVFDIDGPSVTLVFDRAVQLGAGSGMIVVDGPGENRFDSSGGVLLVDPVTILVSLSYLEAAPSGPDVILNAPAPTGISGDPDGVEWMGVSGLVLPFP